MTQHHDIPYLKLLEHIMDEGVDKPNRTGIGARSVFSYQMRFDLSDGTIPLLTTKKIFTKSVIVELLWYLTGDTNIKYLNDRDVHIWDDWADKNGDLGPVYGQMWRKWPTYKQMALKQRNANDQTYDTWYIDGKPIDQIAKLIEKLKTNPNDRRLIVSAWNVELLLLMSLPPCHMSFQCWVGNGRLSLDLTQRSCDSFLGIPFNILSYSLLLRMLAEVTGLQPGEFIWNGKDVHIYDHHFDQVREQLKREPYPSPTFKFARSITDIDDFKFEDFVIEAYESHPAIKAPIAV
ncbi:MAG: thymidylate synthase [Nitrosopumilaceae archaeon]